MPGAGHVRALGGAQRAAAPQRCRHGGHRQEPAAHRLLPLPTHWTMAWTHKLIKW